jgi:protein-tyrosine phosphatase
MKQILFLCSGNYYRSRFAEILFNHLAGENESSWTADSRGIVAEWSHNPGPLSESAIQGLRARRIPIGVQRYPRQLAVSDLELADRIIALYEREHRPLLRQYFPGWQDSVEYWDVPDLNEMESGHALARIERRVLSLITELQGIPETV